MYLIMGTIHSIENGSTDNVFCPFTKTNEYPCDSGECPVPEPYPCDYFNIDNKMRLIERIQSWLYNHLIRSFMNKRNGGKQCAFCGKYENITDDLVYCEFCGNPWYARIE